MKIFEWYIFRNLFVAMLFTAVTLSVVILLTQSLRFLELVIESGASASAFWLLTLLALPRFLEIILPLSLMAAAIFVLNRMSSDSELVIFRSIGFSPSAIARPAIILAALVTLVLWSLTFWVAPKSLASMQQMRQVVKAQFSAILFREGVFNQFGDGLTVYIRERRQDGELLGLMIHDNRQEAKNPSIILAKRGILTVRDEGYEVVVYDGIRQEMDAEKKILHRLNFERYTIDFPDSDPVRQRWKEAEERTIFELLNPNENSNRDQENLRVFHVEIHRRVISPLLAVVLTLSACTLLLLGPTDRRGMSKRITLAVVTAIVLQGAFLAAFNLARQSDFGLALMYALVFVPLFVMLFLISQWGEHTRRTLLYSGGE